jgi:acyl carrier protein
MEHDQTSVVSRDAVFEILASRAGISSAEMTGDRSLPELGINSFGIMRLVLALEDEFGAEFSGAELVAFTTTPVSRLYELVQEAQPAPS